MPKRQQGNITARPEITRPGPPMSQVGSSLGPPPNRPSLRDNDLDSDESEEEIPAESPVIQKGYDELGIH